MITLRPYQQRSIDGLRKSLQSGHKRPILCSPTGSGKTIVSVSLIQAARAKNKKCLFVAPRRELVHQTHRALVAEKMPHGLVMAGEPFQRFREVQIASIDTIMSRDYEIDADLVIVDEIHLFASEARAKWLHKYPMTIGMTATPVLSGGRGLGNIADDIVMGPTVRELTELGYLVPVEYYAPTQVDLAGVKVTAGDYNAKQLGDKMDDPVLIGDVVRNWERLAHDRQTVVFTVNVAHSRHLRERFKEAGYTAEHIDGKTPDDERAEIIKRIHSGETRIVTNCDVLTMGIDIPPLSCVVLARPTRSIARYLQACGRVLRPVEGKTETIVIDHTGTVADLGLVDDVFEWSLGDGTVRERQEKKKTENKELDPFTCDSCKFVWTVTSWSTGPLRCPNCGHDMTSQKEEAIAHIEAELVKLDKKTRKGTPTEHMPRQDFYSELLGYARATDKKDGWAAHKFKKKFKVWPNELSKVSKKPSAVTLAWIKSTQIAYAMAQKRRAGMR